MDSPVFSIIVPTRNRPATLALTLRALSEQSFADFEVIIVDDGSTSEMREALEPLRQEFGARFRWLMLGPAGHGGSGPSRARNYGLEAARGSFVAFCDDDDLWCAPDHLAVAADVLNHSPAADLYLSNQIGLLGEEIRIADWLPRLAAHLTQPQEGHPDVFLLDKAPLIASPQFPHLNILIVRRSLALEIGGFWEQTRYEEDVNFFWRTLDRANVILFRQAITARHAIPLKDQRANVTTSLSEMDKLTLRGLSCRHAATQVTTPALARRILAQEADVLRHLTLILRDQGQIPAARTYARMALAGRFSLKWLLFCLWLSWR